VACDNTGISRNWFWTVKFNLNEVQNLHHTKSTLLVHYRDTPFYFFYTFCSQNSSSLVLPSLKTDAHSVMSKAMFSIFQHPSSSSWIRHHPSNLTEVFLFFSLSSRFALQCLLCCLFVFRLITCSSQASLHHFNYSYNIWKLTCITYFLILFDSQTVIFIILSHVIKVLSITLVIIHDSAPKVTSGRIIVL
jgi:hypothetical protein